MSTGDGCRSQAENLQPTELRMLKAPMLGGHVAGAALAVVVKCIGFECLFGREISAQIIPWPQPAGIDFYAKPLISGILSHSPPR